MCEILGMNCKNPTDILFSFQGFCERGGNTNEHKDGWGIAFFENRGLRLFLDDRPASQSQIAELIKNYPIKSRNVISHIRQANIGARILRNNQPFLRELFGKNFVFCHNGDLYNYNPTHRHYCPVGETDSEGAFCEIMDRIKETFTAENFNSPDLSELLQEEAMRLSEYGVFNFLFSYGESIYAFRTKNLKYITRQHPFSFARLSDKDLVIDFNETNSPADIVTVISTSALTDNEVWHNLPQKQVVLFENGLPVGL